MNEVMEKTKLKLRLYDEDVEVFVEERDKEIYEAAAASITKEMENMMAQFRGTKSEHAISMLTMLRFAIGYHRLNNMGQLQCIIRKLKDHPYFLSNPCIFRRN